MKRKIFGCTFLAVLMWAAPSRAQTFTACDEIPGGTCYVEDYSHGSCCTCSGCCSTGNWFGGAELALLVAHTGGLGVNIPALNTGDFQVTPEYDADVSPRFWLGFEGPDGLGFRARYWFFDQDATGTDLLNAPLPNIDLPIIDLPGNVPFDLSTKLEADAVDLELTECQSFCNWDFQVAAGVRYGRIEETFRFASQDDTVDISRDFEGVGPTVALATRRPIGCNGFALVGGFRASLLYGESDLGLQGLLGGATLTASQHMMETYDVHVGGRWSQDRGGNRMFAQVVYEAQAWELPPMALGILDSNIGFVGATFSVGIER